MTGWLLLGACQLLDASPPVLEVRWPDAPGPHAGPVQLDVVAQDANPVEVQVEGPDGAVLSRGLPATIAAGVLPDGPHTLTIVATDTSAWSHRTVAHVDVLLDTTPPRLDATAVTAGQGRTAVVWVESDEALVDPTLTLFDHVLPLYPVGTAWRALVGVPIEAEIGAAEAALTARDRAGNTVEAPLTFTVTPVDYPAGGFIRLTAEQLAAREDDEARTTMRAERDGAYALVRPEAQFEAFRWPAQGRTTSPFGRYRTYNDGRKSHHTGVDIANAAGTPVVAAAAGEVVIAREQVIFGNAVILHHGQGVTTSYNHLLRIDVAEGDHLDAGAPVGLLGSSGQSTGPHLHFSMVVGEEAVDPMQWLDGDVPRLLSP